MIVDCVRMRRREGPSIKHDKEQSALRGSHTHSYWTLATPSAPAGRRKRRSRINPLSRTLRTVHMRLFCAIEAAAQSMKAEGGFCGHVCGDLSGQGEVRTQEVHTLVSPVKALISSGIT